MEKTVTNVKTESKTGVNWREIARESIMKQQEIYCHVLGEHVRTCRLVSCEHYGSCHSTA